ncbi:hypothetical protein BJY00DRAFT_108595 [Aspergillus carlsbadensis]|nr:hypothetical protein BJY00DRAFT_108595 [Aspergillus carlsbadensis]
MTSPTERDINTSLELMLPSFYPPFPVSSSKDKAATFPCLFSIHKMRLLSLLLLPIMASNVYAYCEDKPIEINCLELRLLPWMCGQSESAGINRCCSEHNCS